MSISPFIWGQGGAVPWEQHQRQQQVQQFQPVQSPLQGLGMMAQSFTNNLRSDQANYFPDMQGGFKFNPWARFTGGSGGLY